MEKFLILLIIIMTLTACSNEPGVTDEYSVSFHSNGDTIESFSDFILVSSYASTITDANVALYKLEDEAYISILEGEELDKVNFTELVALVVKITLL